MACLQAMVAGPDFCRADLPGHSGHRCSAVSRISNQYRMSALNGPDRARAKILWVDHPAADRAFLRRALSGLDVDITVADSGRQALARAQEVEFDLMLIGAALPDMPGVAVVRQLAPEHGLDRDMAVIFITPSPLEEAEQLDIYAAGAVGIIVSAGNTHVLAARLRNIIGQCERRQAWRETATALEQRNRELRTEIEERRRSEARARRLATHDLLTGLPNRLLFLDRLDSALRRAQRAQTMFALGYMDLDGFKPINDTYGHRAGDAALEIIAERLGDNVRKSDTTARLGGDEFALIMEDVSSHAHCLARCTSVRRALGAPMRVPGDGGHLVDIRIGVSIGLAIYPEHGMEPEAIMHNADCALYAVKENGKAGVRIFSPEDEVNPSWLKNTARKGA